MNLASYTSGANAVYVLFLATRSLAAPPSLAAWLASGLNDADAAHFGGEGLCKPPASSRFDFEGEMAVVIGRAGFQITPAAAKAHVGGHDCFNDSSERDWQKHSSQFTPGKNHYRSGSFGPWLITADALPDPSTLRLETRVNGAVKQSIGLEHFIFDIPWLIAYISSFSPLSPGDVIATGTPSDFGCTRQPLEFLVAGDMIEVEVSGVGTLKNTVGDGYGK